MQECLIKKAQELIAKNPNEVIIVVDFTQLQKMYASKMENLGYDHNGCTNRTEKGISLGVLAIVGKSEIVPIKASYWIQKKLANGEYKSKTDLAKDLIKEASNIFGLLKIRLDGAFSSENFLKFLTELGIEFAVRMPTNRIVTTEDGHKSQLKKNPALKLMRNQREKKVKGSYKSVDNLLFISEKRRRKDNEWETVFLVTNIEEFSAKECIAFYAQGGAIEKCFRTLKQSLGVGQCQMLSQDKQMTHILTTFLAYNFLSQQKNIKQKKCPEDIIHMIREGVFAES